MPCLSRHILSMGAETSGESANEEVRSFVQVKA